MTYIEYITQAVQMALSGADASESSLLNAEQTAEALVPSVFRSVTLSLCGDPDKRALLMRSHTIALTTGVGTLASTVLMECLFTGTVSDPDDSTIAKSMSYVPDYFDFLEAKSFEPRLGYWTVIANTTTGNVIRYIRPADTVETKTGNITLVVVTEPAIPALHTDTLNAPQEFIDLATVRLANALRMKVAA